MHFITQLNFIDSRIVKNIKNKEFTCRICNITYTTKSGLSQHNKTKHDDSNPFECKICFKNFASKSKLEIHNRVHTGKKPLSSSY